MIGSIFSGVDDLGGSEEDFVAGMPTLAVKVKAKLLRDPAADDEVGGTGEVTPEVEGGEELAEEDEGKVTGKEDC